MEQNDISIYKTLIIEKRLTLKNINSFLIPLHYGSLNVASGPLKMGKLLVTFNFCNCLK